MTDKGYHATTPSKLARYEATGCILAPVWYWPFRAQAEKWAKEKHRGVLLEIEVGANHPLPRRRCRWSSENVRTWMVLND